MNKTHHIAAPFDPRHITIHIDSSCQAVYVQFSENEVAKTVDCSRDGEIVTVDLDDSGMAVGVEAIGLESLSINRIFRTLEPHLKGLERSQLDDAEIAMPGVAV